VTSPEREEHDPAGRVELGAQLAEAVETLRAIRAGEVDALVVADGSPGEQVFTLSSADRPYRMFVENMRDGAATVSETGIVLYANQSLADLLSRPRSHIIGAPLTSLVVEGHHAALAAQSGLAGTGDKTEIELIGRDGHPIPVRVGASNLDVDSERLVCLTFADLTQLKRDQQQLTRAHDSQRRLAEIVESSDDAILSKTLDGTITSWNGGAERLFGYRSEEAVGRPVSMLVPPELAGEVPAFLERVRGGESIERYETKRRTKDGSTIDVSLTISPVRDPDGTVTGASAIARDVSERKLVERERESAREEAERANRAKSEFLSRMSHELRTPLNAVLGFAQLLEMDDLDESHSDSVEHILSAGRHLLGLIDEVLDISRIESETMSLSIESVDVGAITDEVLTLLKPMAAKRDIELRIELREASGPHVCADVQRLKQVLLNLLSNAIKYNRAGGRVTVSFEEGAGERLRILVSDTGPGIPADMIERLFAPFDRLGAERTQVEGTGLGLALSKRLMEAMGASLGVDSEPGRGTTFCVELALEDSKEEQERPARVAPAAGTNGSNPGHRSLLR
jgi:PAS domain S-box-containing protein